MEIRSIVQAKTGSTVGTSAVGESRCIKFIHRSARASAERNHAAVANRGRSLVKRLTNPKSKFACATVFIDTPPGRNTIPFRVARNATRHVEWSQRRIVESNGPFKIVGTEEDVRQHHVPPDGKANCIQDRRSDVSSRPSAVVGESRLPVKLIVQNFVHCDQYIQDLQQACAHRGRKRIAGRPGFACTRSLLE
jgi:hypothetical protein